MASATPTLPAGWAKILDEVHLRLDHAIAASNARIEQLPHHSAIVPVQERHLEVLKWSERLQRLSTYLESTEQVVQSADEALQKEESLLRHHLESSGTLRQRLAEGTGRAIE